MSLLSDIRITIVFRFSLLSLLALVIKSILSLKGFYGAKSTDFMESDEQVEFRVALTVTKSTLS